MAWKFWRCRNDARNIARHRWGPRYSRRQWMRGTEVTRSRSHGNLTTDSGSSQLQAVSRHLQHPAATATLPANADQRQVSATFSTRSHGDAIARELMKMNQVTHLFASSAWLNRRGALVYHEWPRLSSRPAPRYAGCERVPDLPRRLAARSRSSGVQIAK